MRSRIAVLLLGVAAQAADHPITSARFSPDGTRLALAGGVQVRIEPAGQRIVSRLGQVFGVAWSPDGKWIAVSGGTAGVTGAVELWSASDLGLQKTFARCGDLIYAVAFSPDSTALAAGSADHRAYVVDVATGETKNRLNGHVGPVLALAWSPSGNTLATASADRSVRIWNAADGSLARALTNHNGAVESVVFAPDGQELYSASSDATVRVWVPSNGRMKRILRGFEQPVLSLDYIASRKLLLTGSADSTVRLVSPETGDVSERIDHHAWPQAVAADRDGSRIAWADTAGRYVIREATR
jgi:WD40 repeat protein